MRTLCNLLIYIFYLFYHFGFQDVPDHCVSFYHLILLPALKAIVTMPEHSPCSDVCNGFSYLTLKLANYQGFVNGLQH